MTPPRAPHPRHVRYGVRYQARLDGETSAKLDELARTFHRKRSVVLRFVMGWGLDQTQGWTVDATIPTSPQLVTMLVSPELQQQVQETANRYHVTGAAWLRHAMRQVTRDDFPASWRAGEMTVRSHESGYYGRKFGEDSHETFPRCHRVAPVGLAHRLRRVSPRGTPSRDDTTRGGPAPQPRRHSGGADAFACIRI
jgi:predicted transcriptional regulator